MDPAEVLSRLRMPESDSEIAQRLAARASSALVRALGFDPYYRSWRQEWRRERTGERYGTMLDLEPRPFVSLTALTDASDVALTVDTDFTVVPTRRASGEVYLLRPDGWTVYGIAGVGPDWTATLTAGWWTPGMSGAAPSGAPVLPEDLQEAAFRLAKALAERDAANDSLERVSRADAEVVFRQAQPGMGSLPPGVAEMIGPYRAIQI